MQGLLGSRALSWQPADAVAGWQAQFDAAMRQKKELADDAAATQARMDSANALLSALAGEEGRWTAQSQAFDTTIQRLTGALLGLRAQDVGLRVEAALGCTLPLRDWAAGLLLGPGCWIPC